MLDDKIQGWFAVLRLVIMNINRSSIVWQILRAVHGGNVTILDHGSIHQVTVNKYVLQFWIQALIRPSTPSNQCQVRKSVHAEAAVWANLLLH